MKTLRSLFCSAGLLLMAFLTPAFAQAPAAPAVPAATPAPRATAAPATTTAATTTPAEKTVEVNKAARVSLVEGDVTVIGADKKRRQVVAGDAIVEGDSIVTGKDGELHLDMEDGGYISVRPGTKMRIVKYQAKGESTDTGVFGLLEGGFRSLTGWIGKYNRNAYTVRTPNATIGIRGTDHEPYVIAKGSSEGDPGTYDKVNEGGSFIQTAGGRADVAPNQAGYVSPDKAAKPRLLKEIPRHFRAGRHEALFKGRHAEIQQRIEKRREDRRSEIRQKLQNVKSEAAGRRDQRVQALREKREATQKQREDARHAREAAKKSGKAAAKDEYGKDDDATKGEHARATHKVHKQ